MVGRLAAPRARRRATSSSCAPARDRSGCSPSPAPTRRLVCVDVNPVAATYARRNAEAAGLAERVIVREGLIDDVLEPHERFPLIIADPPWVPRNETARFPEDPLLAIDGGDDGLQVVRACLRAIQKHLAPDGVALLQLGTTAQVAGVAEVLEPTDLVAGEVREYGEHGVLLEGRPPALSPSVSGRAVFRCAR